MPSPGDIPEHLLGRHNWDAFVSWVHMHYFTLSERKELGRYWSALSKVPLTREMWQQLLYGQPAPHGL